MKLKELKKLLNKLNKNQLEQELLFNDVGGCKSGIATIIRQPCDLLYDGSDDPATLYTRKEVLKKIKDCGGSKEELDEEWIVEISRGSYVVVLNR